MATFPTACTRRRFRKPFSQTVALSFDLKTTPPPSQIIDNRHQIIDNLRRRQEFTEKLTRRRGHQQKTLLSLCGEQIGTTGEIGEVGTNRFLPSKASPFGKSGPTSKESPDDTVSRGSHFL
ncbi:MAG: hypothetical protein KDA81_07065 [Planctomycetaceae bacterium]|nr:hypothetical protein [Planctomycetaceae bacterium]